MKMQRHPLSRRGLSLVEAMIAMLMLATGFVALLSLSSGESQRVDITRQRLLADQALRQLRESQAPALQEELREFPDSLAAFDANPLYASAIVELPGIAIPADPDRAALAQAFEEALVSDGIQRAILYRDTTGPGAPGLATYIVRYPGPNGELRTLQAHRVLYD